MIRAAAVLCACAAVYGCAATPSDAPPGWHGDGDTVDADGMTVYGRADYDWTLGTLDGDTLRLDRFHDRVLFINVWATWCPPCVGELASIERLRGSLDADVEFLLVSPEDAAPVRRFLRRYGYALPVYLEREEMPAAFGLRALPTTFVVDRAGRIVLKHRGAAEWDDAAVREFLAALASRPPAREPS